MKHAVFTFGRFNPPTEAGHGKLINSVKSHAEKVGGDHFIFPSHSQDAKKNPLSHTDKVSAMHKVFPKTNVVSDKNVKTAIDALKHVEKKGYTHATMVVGSDRVGEFHKLLNKYNGKEYNFKKIHVKSAGNRDPDAEGAEGMSASKLRGLVKSGKRDEFISHYSNKKVGAEIHDKVKAAMNEESQTPVGIFLFGGPGSGKDYVLKNIFSRFNLVEVQADQILNGSAMPLIEYNQNVVINCSAENSAQIEYIKSLLEGYDFDHVYVSVSNKVSRQRNELRLNPLKEDLRIGKMLKAEKLAKALPDVFTFNNSCNLAESTEMEKILFASQIEKLLERLVQKGLVFESDPSPKSFAQLREENKNVQVSKKVIRAEAEEVGCGCGGSCGGDCSCGGSCGCASSGRNASGIASFSSTVQEEERTVKILNSLKNKIKAKKGVGPTPYDGRLGINIGLISSPTAIGSPNASTSIAEDLRTWFKQDWKRLNTKGEIIGDCAREEGEGKPKCLPLAQARAMSKEDRAKAARRKRRQDPVADREGKGNKPIMVRTEEVLTEKNVPTNPSLWSQAKSLAKQKFDVYPSAYANGWAAKWYKSKGGGWKTVSEQTLAESVQYHLENDISFTKNIYRPGSEMFFALIKEAKKLYAEGKYKPEDEYELEVLTSNIGEKAIYEGKEVLLDFPFEVLDEEGSDPTKGHGIGKPFRKGGGGAVYVRSGDGVKLVNFSQSGMTKKYNDPARLKSFMARHNCLGNKDKTSASYWACRWPRYFSSGGQQWW